MAGKMTQWFRGVQPVREGVYETEYGYQWYSPRAKMWFGYASTPVDAENSFFVDYESSRQQPEWRGFTKKQRLK